MDSYSIMSILFVLAVTVLCMNTGARLGRPSAVKDENIKKTFTPLWLIVLICAVIILPFSLPISHSFKTSSAMNSLPFCTGYWLGGFIVGILLEKLIWSKFPDRTNAWLNSLVEQKRSQEEQTQRRKEERLAKVAVVDDCDEPVRLTTESALRKFKDPGAIAALQERNPGVATFCAICGRIIEDKEMKRGEQSARLDAALGGLSAIEFLAEGFGGDDTMKARAKYIPNFAEGLAMKCNRCGAWICIECAGEAEPGMIQHSGCGGMFETPQ